MMHEPQENTPFEPRDRNRLQAGVRARRRARTAWMAGGSVLAIAGLGVGLVVLPNAFAEDRPPAPQHRPVSTTKPVPTPTPTEAPVPVPPAPPQTTGTVPAPTRTSSSRPVPVPPPTRTSSSRPVRVPPTEAPVPVPSPTQTSAS
ncbi:hypothetical protein FBY35_1095 [Streptomyces sp. SLBN-118]|nr:hypothetical protein FBY35_1095 [Streptomyces sp. SLBN-118]